MPTHAHWTSVLRTLLLEDPFARIRTDRGLARLEGATAKRHAQPYGWLVAQLVGRNPHLDESEAEALWRECRRHRATMSRALRRTVALRVAALDLLYRRGAALRRPALLVDSSVIEGVLGALSLDELTGLMSRERFMAILDHELTQRARPHAVLAFMDLDGFKRVNDRFGHDRGDEVLARFGRAARGAVRQGDPVARVGGDEFVALFLGCGLRRARAIVSRIEEQLAARYRALGVGFSTGFATLRRGDTVRAVLKRADAAMYRVKRRRRARRTGQRAARA
ncbi:MAG: GGDEF domain-containing protein [Gemmatimonadales bacterium]|jgi:diguanylate cyclase (GGDEF)-like protein|nr:GGDEF domain-containing protein [Gemmatimonadales bacterium]